MSIPKRNNAIPGTYFVTSRTWESRALFRNDFLCQLFIDSLLHYRNEGAYKLHESVLMPDHFHILLTPALDRSLERVVQYIKGGSARKLSLVGNLRFPVWQKGFSDHRLRDFSDFATHVRYIANNPVRKKLVATAKEFRWSSASGTYELDAVPLGLEPQQEGSLTSLRRG